MSTTTTVMAPIEARTASKWPGKCKRCHQPIPVGATIVKVSGAWVCEPCGNIPPVSALSGPAPPPQPVAEATAPVPTTPPPGTEPPRGAESVEEMHARVWRFAVYQAAQVPDADPRERRITALAFYKAIFAAEIARS